MSLTPLVFQMKKAEAQSDQGDSARMWKLELTSALSSASVLGLCPCCMITLYASGIIRHPNHYMVSIICILPISNICGCFMINKIKFH